MIPEEYKRIWEEHDMISEEFKRIWKEMEETMDGDLIKIRRW